MRNASDRHVSRCDGLFRSFSLTNAGRTLSKSTGISHGSCSCEPESPLSLRILGTESEFKQGNLSVWLCPIGKVDNSQESTRRRHHFYTLHKKKLVLCRSNTRLHEQQSRLFLSSSIHCIKLLSFLLPSIDLAPAIRSLPSVECVLSRVHCC